MFKIKRKTMRQNIINERKIQGILEKTKNPSQKALSDIFKKARDLKGLDLEEAGLLINSNDPDTRKELFRTSHRIKFQIYGERLVFFAPLYISDFCVNDCEYCNFHSRNRDLVRKKLTLREVEEQTKFLIDMGHKRLLLEFGEDMINNPIGYVTEVIEKIYSVKTKKGNIRRVNVNIAATSVENYRKLKRANIGTYQLFQETYHRKTYEKLHSGPKADYDRQITAHTKAFEAGLDDLGIGVLFGLYDWRFEVLALISHARYMDREFGVGPHTISVPRFCPAPSVVYNPPYKVNDEDFLKLIAILRLAVPYTGMIITTRETPVIRKLAFKIGISQASAASVTSPGGYGKDIGKRMQFELHDQRSLYEIIDSVLEDELLPSFCTACYRIGRTGKKFMSFSKPGEIHKFCRPNGILTFAEYLEDFGEDGIYEKGNKLIKFYLGKIEDENLLKETKSRLAKIKEGKRDLYF
ncbi:MAG: [FeFe] hydrogenase H-cluster radical SAM maturase HydG [Candidatus Omnitrophica bacterium]|nr:[FeFe] hydrogenase H-cluster radical SAM maturase HydG [Candidatus Omnitrophota bacterium]